MIPVEPIRPRIATVAAVVWLYSGSAWTLLGAAMLLAMSIVTRLVGDASWLDVLPLFFGGIAVAGALGVVGALQLLRLRERGRRLVQVASWSAFAVLQLFALRVAYALSCSPGYFGGEPRFDNPGRGLLPAFEGLLVGLPFLVIALKLRSGELQFAIRDAEGRRNS